MTTVTSTNVNSETTFTKLDPAGNLIWSKHFSFSGGGGNAEIDRITLYTSGEILVMGDLNDGTLDVDPGIGTVNLSASGVENEVFIARYDINGNHIWSSKMNDVALLNTPMALLLIHKETLTLPI